MAGWTSRSTLSLSKFFQNLRSSPLPGLQQLSFHHREGKRGGGGGPERNGRKVCEAKLNLANALAYREHAPAQRVVLLLLREGALHAKDEKVHVQEQGKLLVDVWRESEQRQAARSEKEA